MKYCGKDREYPTLMCAKKRQQLIDFCSQELGENQENKTPDIKEILAMVRASQKAREMRPDAI